jgi:hypothetical protein
VNLILTCYCRSELFETCHVIRMFISYLYSVILFWIMSAKREYVSFHSVSFQMSLVLACKRFCEFFFMVFAIHKNLICWIQFQYILLHHYATYLLFILLLFLLLADGSCANLSGFPDSGVCLQGRRLSHEIQTCKFRP